ncbi:MAG: prolyl oligopeptidase family serine peptidase, partial [Thermoguttaceae bacterium]|nr:prolyl oligopeptidase family serine peptidase [Thermoguttaceae bacterium]
QRCVRFVRAHAEEWEINPEKIGILGFSAGGHLTLMTATSSLTNSYDPVDDIDKLSASVAFAVPIYPAYVLEDGADGPNVDKGNDSTMVEDFAFDEKTPPMCLFHGDADAYSPMGSVAVYAKLRKMNIPAEMHIYATIEHGFGGNPKDDHVGDWLNRVYAWMKVVGF